MFYKGRLTKALTRECLRDLFANITGWQVLRVFLGLTILTAALFKVHELSTTPYLDKFPPRWAMIVFVELEILFALWLFFVPKRLLQVTWLATLALFSFFACVTLYKALTGAASCGCFGSVKINPWHTLIFDVTVIGLLLWLLCHVGSGCFGRIAINPLHACELDLAIVESLLSWRPKKPFSVTNRATTVVMIWLLIGIPTVLAMGSFSSTVLSDAGEIIGDGKTVVLQPKTWTGKRFPMLPFIEDYFDSAHRSTNKKVRDRLTDGKWLVVLYRYDCPMCKKAMSTYNELACRSIIDPTVPRVAMIEVPPYGNQKSLLPTLDTSCAIGRLSDKKDWFVQVPVEITCNHGVVEGITEIEIN